MGGLEGGLKSRSMNISEFCFRGKFKQISDLKIWKGMLCCNFLILKKNSSNLLETFLTKKFSPQFYTDFLVLGQFCLGQFSTVQIVSYNLVAN
jgi:hypothetical protein